jgi:hypothetical protein
MHRQKLPCHVNFCATISFDKGQLHSSSQLPNQPTPPPLPTIHPALLDDQLTNLLNPNHNSQPPASPTSPSHRRHKRDYNGKKWLWSPLQHRASNGIISARQHRLVPATMCLHGVRDTRPVCRLVPFLLKLLGVSEAAWERESRRNSAARIYCRSRDKGYRIRSQFQGRIWDRKRDWNGGWWLGRRN